MYILIYVAPFCLLVIIVRTKRAQTGRRPYVEAIDQFFGVFGWEFNPSLGLVVFEIMLSVITQNIPMPKS